MRRMGMVIGIRPERIDAYKSLHADVWPEVLARIKASHIVDYTIFLRQPENLLFGTWTYLGDDFEADMKAMADDPATQRWWDLTAPMQAALESRADGEWWAMMEEVFHLD